MAKKKVVVVLEPEIQESVFFSNDDDLEIYLVVKDQPQDGRVVGAIAHAKTERDDDRVNEWARLIEQMKAHANYREN